MGKIVSFPASLFKRGGLDDLGPRLGNLKKGGQKKEANDNFDFLRGLKHKRGPEILIFNLSSDSSFFEKIFQIKQSKQIK